MATVDRRAAPGRARPHSHHGADEGPEVRDLPLPSVAETKKPADISNKARGNHDFGAQAGGDNRPAGRRGTDPQGEGERADDRPTGGR